MNIGALFTQVPMLQSNQNLPSSSQGHESGFGNILEVISSGSLNSETSSIRLMLSNKDSVKQELMKLLQQFTEDKGQLLELLGIDNNQLEELAEKISQEEVQQLQEKLNLAELDEVEAAMLQLYMSSAGKDLTEQGLKTEQFFALQGLVNVQGSAKLGENDQLMLNQANQLWGKIQTVLQQVNADSLTNEQSVQLLKLMKQWNDVNQTAPQIANQVLANQKGPETKLWDQLMSLYQKRMNGVMKGAYQSNATVTSTDVTKWLKNALSNYSNETNEAVKHPNVAPSATGQAISKVEQHMIYMNQSNANHSKVNQNELIEKFQQILNSSKFLSKAKGSNELLLRLNPRQLGDITVKMIQQNGEMLVKITTTTQLAKDALEGNLQQLKHMFSPQQVVIEKQDTQQMHLSQQDVQHEFGDQMSESSHQEDETKDNQDESMTEESLSFKELLMNEKV
ncbi:flagellar hook-length control protein FliK [Paraliobacillus salinarum]|uniref:flagellar hook-length control protein FliK n=1 Tax=Paraliobacillus salinarum TaxID=1158996 RepID=UPI0015F6C3E2|nr:flagellar hook-length control protein FliK [Paraliobacillus salinarum]